MMKSVRDANLLQDSDKDVGGRVECLQTSHETGDEENSTAAVKTSRRRSDIGVRLTSSSTSVGRAAFNIADTRQSVDDDVEGCFKSTGASDTDSVSVNTLTNLPFIDTFNGVVSRRAIIKVSIIPLLHIIFRFYRPR